PGPQGDLNGDGTPDVLVVQPGDRWPGTILALSGRTGRRLWSASDIPSRPYGEGTLPTTFLDFSPDQDGDGRPDVIASYRLPAETQAGSEEPLEWSIVVSGRRGTVLATLNSLSVPEEYSRWRLVFSDQAIDLIEPIGLSRVHPLATSDPRAPQRVVEIR